MKLTSSTLRGAALGVSIMLLSACANHVADSGVYYNNGLATSSNSVLLTNVMRAAKGYPVYYSVVGEYSASREVSNGSRIGANLDGDFALQGVTLGLGPPSVTRNQSVSSLETSVFVKAMHSRLSPSAFAMFFNSGNRADLHLKLALLVDGVAITSDQYAAITAAARARCAKASDITDVSAYKMCATYIALEPGDCATTSDRSTNTIVRFRNDPTDQCAYGQFRHFVEGFVLARPWANLSVVPAATDGADAGKASTGNLVVGIGSVDANGVFTAPNTGFELRSPTAAVTYLGQIVRNSYRNGWTPTLSTREGDSVPIITVHRGEGRGQAMRATLDGQGYWLAAQGLAAPRTDLGTQALSIIKDVQALNVSQDQVPESPSILIGR